MARELRQTRAVHPAQIPLLLPGSFVDVTVPVHGVYPQLWMKASVTLQPLVVQGDVDPGLAQQYAVSTHFWAIPWLLIGIIVALGVGLWWWRRRRRARRVTGGRHRSGPSTAAKKQTTESKEAVA